VNISKVKTVIVAVFLMFRLLVVLSYTYLSIRFSIWIRRVYYKYRFKRVLSSYGLSKDAVSELVAIYDGKLREFYPKLRFRELLTP